MKKQVICPSPVSIQELQLAWPRASVERQRMDSREAIRGHRTNRSNCQADPHSPAYTTSGAGQMLQDFLGKYKELSQPLCRARGGGIGNELRG